jgi:formylglycine-generating enzyme required for sulfatase activity
VGTVIITATIADGTVAGMDYTQDFSIDIDLLPAYTFILVPAGSFQRDDTAANVTIITRSYWMGETEVTQELFQAVMGTNPSNFTSNPEDGSADGWKRLPVEEVSWYEAIAFCNKLSLLDGKDPVYSVSGISDWAGLAYSAIPTSMYTDWDAATMDTGKDGYRLPTEMEWMWAAMGADKTVQPNIAGYTKDFAGSTGSNSVGDYAWYDSNSNSKTHEVGMKAANELGLKDMSGNVWEWCWDRYDSYYPDGTLTDYQGPVSKSYGPMSKGSVWSNDMSGYTVANKTFLFVSQTPGSGDGFRVVCGQ